MRQSNPLLAEGWVPSTDLVESEARHKKHGYPSVGTLAFWNRFKASNFGEHHSLHRWYLGLRIALRFSDRWLTGSCYCGVTTCYCMLLLVQCREKSASEGSLVEAKTYGDLGYRNLGTSGRHLTETLILLSQCGGSVAYLVFIGQNLQSVFQHHGLTLTCYIILLESIEIGFSWIGNLSALAPFSIFADVCNVLAMGTVLKEDMQALVEGEFSFGQRRAITVFRGFFGRRHGDFLFRGFWDYTGLAEFYAG